jgi:hypothetical protein
MRILTVIVLGLCLGVFACQKTEPAVSAPAVAPAPEAPKPAEVAKVVEPTPAAAEPAPKGTAEPAWLDYAGENNQFTCQFPGKPEVTEQQTPSDLGVMKFKMAMLDESGTKQRAFSAFASTMPIPKGTAFDIKAALDGARDQMLQAMGMKLISETAIELAGAKGHEIRYGGEISGLKASGIVRNWVRGTPPTLYQANAMFLGTTDEAAAMKFLDSYKIPAKD